MMNGSDAVIVDAVRTPMGKHRGQLSGTRPDDLVAGVIEAVVGRYPKVKDRIDDVYVGCANQAGEDNRNVARMGALIADLADSVPGVTVNRLCGSGLEAVNQAAKAIRTNEGTLFIAGGVESMSRAPWALPKAPQAFARGNLVAYDTALGWRFPNPRLEARFPLEAMGETAENVADRWGISREAQDAYALESHRRVLESARNGEFRDEVVSVEARRGKEIETLREDEGPRRDASLDKLRSLHPVFRRDGSVTAGNSCTLADGASAVLVCSARVAEELGLEPIAVIRSWAVAGVNPGVMGVGPVPAARKALERIRWSVDDLDTVEINEAFSATVLACIGELGLDPARVNPQGGAIALGHPLGCSGARILTTLAHRMRRSGARRGLASACIGVGQGIATVLERI